MSSDLAITQWIQFIQAPSAATREENSHFPGAPLPLWTADGWLCVLTPRLLLRQLRQSDTKPPRVPNRHLKDIFKENSLLLADM